MPGSQTNIGSIDLVDPGAQILASQASVDKATRSRVVATTVHDCMMALTIQAATATNTAKTMSKATRRTEVMPTR